MPLQTQRPNDLTTQEILNRVLDRTNNRLNTTVVPAGFDALVDLLLTQHQILVIPTNTGWTEVSEGSGATTADPFKIEVATGANANSSEIASLGVYNLSAATGLRSRIDWDKKIAFAFTLARSGNNAAIVGYLHIAQSAGHTDLAAKGVGLKFANLTVTAESYGTSLASETLFTAAANRFYHILIVVDSAGGTIKVYVDGVLTVTQSTATKIPTGTGGGTASIVVSMDNAAVAVNGQLSCSPIIIIQEV